MCRLFKLSGLFFLIAILVGNTAFGVAKEQGNVDATAEVSVDLETAQQLPEEYPASVQERVLYRPSDDFEVVDQVLDATARARLKYRNLLAQGILYRNQGEDARAIKVFEEALEYQPNSVVVLVEMADIVYQDDAARAGEYLDRAIQIDPDYYRLHFVAALLHEKNREYEQVLAALDRCLEQESNHTDARQMRVRYLMQFQPTPEKLRRAIEDFQVLLQMVPQQALLWNFRIGQCYFQLKEYARAQKYLKPLLETPLQPQVAYLLNLCEQHLGQFSEAVESAEQPRDSLIQTINRLKIALIQTSSATGEERDTMLRQALVLMLELYNSDDYSPQPAELMMAAEVARELGNYQISIDFLQRYLEKAPEDRKTQILLLQAQLAMGDISSAEQIDKTIDWLLETQAATETLGIRIQYAHYLLDTKQLGRLQERWEVIEGDRFPDPQRTLLKSRMEFGLEKYESSIAILHKYRGATGESAPFPPEMALLLGQAYLLSGSPEQAEQQFNYIIENASPNHTVQFCLEIGEFYLQHGMADKGIPFWQKVYELNPTNDQLAFEIGRAYLRSASPQQGEPYLQQVATRADSVRLRSHAFSVLGFLAILNSATDQAESYYLQAYEIDPHSDLAVRGLASFYSQMENYEAAYEYCRIVAEANPQNATLLIQFAIACNELDRVAEAEQIARQAMEVDPSYSEAYNFLGYLYAERGINLDEAENLVKQALEIEPRNPNITDSLGWVYYKQGRYAEAVEWLKRAVDLLPDEGVYGAGVIYEHLGDAYEKLGDLPTAIQWWRKALSAEPPSETVGEKLQRHEQ